MITVRESARIESFGDHFIWPDWVPRLQQYRQVGNAVPPLMAASVVRALAEILDRDLDPEQFLGDPGTRPPSITTTPEFRFAERLRRTRGASFGGETG